MLLLLLALAGLLLLLLPLLLVVVGLRRGAGMVSSKEECLGVEGRGECTCVV